MARASASQRPNFGGAEMAVERVRRNHPTEPGMVDVVSDSLRLDHLGNGASGSCSRARRGAFGNGCRRGPNRGFSRGSRTGWAAAIGGRECLREPDTLSRLQLYQNCPCGRTIMICSEGRRRSALVPASRPKRRRFPCRGDPKSSRHQPRSADDAREQSSYGPFQSCCRRSLLGRLCMAVA
jgi:hypothetical protein